MLNVATSEFELKSVADAGGIGTFEGYASTFGNIDRGGDVVEKNAFVGSFKRVADVAMLWAHNRAELIGGWKDITENGAGLYVKGELNLKVQRGAEAYELMKAGHLASMSIGYRTKEYKDEKLGLKYIRRLLKVALYEISLTPIPMNTHAAVMGVKGIGGAEIQSLERILSAKGLSKSHSDIAVDAVKTWLDSGGEPQGITEVTGGDANSEELRKLFAGYSFTQRS